MQNDNYNLQNRLITPWGYIGYSLLFSIPVVGLICVLIFAFSPDYPCRRNYARSFLIMLVIALVIVGIAVAMGVNFAAILRNSGYGYYY